MILNAAVGQETASIISSLETTSIQTLRVGFFLLPLLFFKEVIPIGSVPLFLLPAPHVTPAIKPPL